MPTGIDTNINCPSCEDVTMLTATGEKRVCPKCGYSEPHEHPSHNRKTSHGYKVRLPPR